MQTECRIGGGEEEIRHCIGELPLTLAVTIITKMLSAVTDEMHHKLPAANGHVLFGRPTTTQRAESLPRDTIDAGDVTRED